MMTYDLSAPVIVVWGPNGTGKTTFFDAMLWLLQGELPRLSPHASAGDNETVLSAYADGTDARVSADLRTRDGVFTIRRIGTSRASSLHVVAPDLSETQGLNAEARLRQLLPTGDLTLPEMMRTSGMLQQDDLRQVLNDRPDDRYKQLLRLLGLEKLQGYEKSVDAGLAESRKRLKAAKERVETQRLLTKQLQEQLNTMVALSSQSEIATSELDDVREAIEGAAGTLDVMTVSPSVEDLSRLVSASLTLRDEVESAASSITSALSAVPPVAEPEFDQKSVDSAYEAVESAQRTLDELQFERQRLREAQNQIAELIALAIPLLEDNTHGDHTTCPVCETEVPLRSVLFQLQQRDTGANKLTESERELEAARERFAAASASLNELRLSADHYRRRQQDRAAAEASARTIMSRLVDLSNHETLRVVGVAPRTLEPDTVALRWLQESAEDLLTRLERAARAAAWIAQTSSAASRRVAARREALNRASQRPRLEAQLSSVSSELRSADTDYESARDVEREARRLRESVATATEAILTERFDAVRPLMNDIYTRLDPHPTFTKLDFVVDRYRARGTANAAVVDEAQELVANPLVVFSSAQTNVVVLSTFLALGWSALQRSLPFVMLDDPLQSLDDVNVLGFADLIRSMRLDKQIIVSTHEERFARLLERKLSGYNPDEDVIVHRFLSWDREGPVVETRRVGRTRMLHAS